LTQKQILQICISVFRKVFSVWERTNLVTGVRERLEVSLIKTGAAVLNARDRKFSKNEASLGYPTLRKKFEARTGYSLSLDDPQTFCEKMQWRKFNDRNSLFPILSDKLRAKEWIREKIGEERTVPTIFHTTSVLELPIGIENESLILKTNHDSGGQLIVSPELGRTRGEIIRYMSQYFFRDFGIRKFEWAYTQINRAVLAEPLLGGSPDQLPDDVRIHVFGGRVKYIQYQTAKFFAEENQIHIDGTLLLSPEWTPLSIKRRNDTVLDLPPRPREFERMIEIAEILSAGLDFLRVDFFVMKGEFYVSETTVYASAGYQQFDPVDYDHELGQLWILPNSNVNGNLGTEYLRRGSLS